RAHATERSARMKAIPGRTSTTFHVLAVSFVVAAALTACSKRPASPELSMDADDIAATVTSPTGPDAGARDIADTPALPTRFAQIVVTDDQGRFLIPDLPPANYEIWVRGYGLADSAKVAGEPGKRVNLTATVAADAATAAKVYPAAYWYAMMKLPA